MHNIALMARFNAWANQRLYGAVAEMRDEDYRADRGAFFGSVHATLNHLLVVDILWRARIEGWRPEIAGLDQILHETFKDLSEARREEDLKLIGLTDSLDGASLESEVSFGLLKSPDRRLSLRRDHILITLFNHQTHHRGQVHCLLTQSGITPPPLDVLDYLLG